jgi:hypothetical protein
LEFGPHGIGLTDLSAVPIVRALSRNYSGIKQFDDQMACGGRSSYLAVLWVSLPLLASPQFLNVSVPGKAIQLFAGRNIIVPEKAIM